MAWGADWLTDGGNPANGQYDMEFTLWDAMTSGNQVGGPDLRANVQVANGLFTVWLNQGNQFSSHAFDGNRRFLGQPTFNFLDYITHLEYTPRGKAVSYEQLAIGHSCSLSASASSRSFFQEQTGRKLIECLDHDGIARRDRMLLVVEYCLRAGRRCSNRDKCWANSSRLPKL